MHTMHEACPLSELAPGEARRLDTAPSIAVFLTEEGDLDASPATLPVRTHKVKIVDGNTMVLESDEAPNLPPGLAPEGHV
ncbi:3-phenylpropionate/trans-cinnamate dioxygenase ferredoxin subunit [Arthrobacter oryzae]|nr:3-phenylpropionate/trans-cinnamate dioxygenase ferredoxin subunit [Arthrobacter oryzae]